MVTTPTNTWIKCFKPNPEAYLRLFCFPYAGGSALAFRDWPDQLSTVIEVCSIELPGRGMHLHKTPFTRMRPLVMEIAQFLLAYLDKPFAFFGHSMGALVSFELARLLRKDYNCNPIHLFVSGRRAPHIPEVSPPIYPLPDADFLEELRQFNGTPEAVLANKDLMQLLLPSLRADFEAHETYTYQPEPPLNCAISAFGGFQDLTVNCEMLKAWQEQTLDVFSMQMFPGDHFFIHTEKSSLLQSLNQKLSELALQIS